MIEQPDLVVRGGSVVREGRIETADVAVVGERIEWVGARAPKGRREINAGGALVLPGVIDAHVHLNADWPFPAERTPVEGWRDGTRSAAAGGVTTVLDFAYQHADRDLHTSVANAVAVAAAESAVDFSFHPTVTEWRPGMAESIAHLVEEGFPTFKAYTGLPDFVAHGPEYLSLFRAVGAAGGMQLFHCEDDALLEWGRRCVLETGVTSPSAYGRSKPVNIEEAAVERTLRLADATGVRAYLVHISAAESLTAIARARARGTEVFVETRPIYLHLTEERYDAPDEVAARYIGTPPLRSVTHREAIWKALADGSLDTVASDHVGFALADKYRLGDTFETVPKGMPNLETMLPLLLTEARDRGVSVPRVAEVLSEAPARLFGLWPRKGAIAVGADADLVAVDLQARGVVGPRPLHGAADFDVYEGTRLSCAVTLTLSRGQVIFEGGEVTAAAGRGRLAERRPPDDATLNRLASRRAAAAARGGDA